MHRRGEITLAFQNQGMRDLVNVQICSIENAANHMSHSIREMGGDGSRARACV